MFKWDRMLLPKCLGSKNQWSWDKRLQIRTDTWEQRRRIPVLCLLTSIIHRLGHETSYKK